MPAHGWKFGIDSPGISSSPGAATCLLELDFLTFVVP